MRLLAYTSLTRDRFLFNRGTVVQDNINPIVKVEKSSVLLASTILSEHPNTLLANEKDVTRLKGAFPELMES